MACASTLYSFPRNFTVSYTIFISIIYLKLTFVCQKTRIQCNASEYVQLISNLTEETHHSGYPGERITVHMCVNLCLDFPH